MVGVKLTMLDINVFVYASTWYTSPMLSLLSDVGYVFGLESRKSRKLQKSNV